jgi:MFS family permease
VPAERLLTAPFLLCFCANLLQGLAFNLFLHFPRFLHDLGADDVEIGFVTSLTAIAAIALRPPIGRAMDRRGRREIILAGGLLNSLVVGLYFTVDSIGPWLYAVRVGHGLAEAMLFSSLFTYAADHVPARARTQGLALFGVSGMLPIALGGVLGDVLLGSGHVGWLFGVSLALAVASLLLSLPMPESPRPDHPHDPDSLGLRAALVQRDLVPLWWIGTVFSIALTAFFVFTRRFVDETGIGSVGLFFSAYTAAAIVLRVGFGWVPDRIGPKRALAPSLGCLVLGFAWMARSGDAADLAAAGVLCGVGHGATFPILFGLVVNRASEANRGMVMAVYTALFDIGVLLGGPSLGWLVEHAGFPSMYGAAGLLLAAGTAVFFAWDRRAHAP